MADSYDIIISAVDSASEAFQSIINTVQQFGSDVTDNVSKASAEFDEFDSTTSSSLDDLEAAFEEATSEVERLQDALDEAHFNGDDIEADRLADELYYAEEEAERLQEAIANFDASGFQEAADEADELEKEVDEAADAMDRLGSAGDVKAAETLMGMSESLTGFMSDAANTAGSFQDSMTRMSLAAEGAGISVEDMTSAVSAMSDETGRAGGTVREAFIAMTSAGITDMQTMQSVFQGASAQAFILGTDVNALADKFAGMAMKSTLSEKTLKGTGITMKELGEAMGMTGATADEVKEKWKSLDTNQRAAALGVAASMNEGKNANDEYKTSWQGLQEQVEIAKGRLERIVGSVILPVLIPAMKIASDILNGVGDVISGIMAGPLGGLVSILGTLAGVFVIVVTGAAGLRAILGFLQIQTTLDTAATILNTAAKILNGEASGAGAIANLLLGESFMASAAAAWAAAAGFLAAAWPLLVIVGVIALVVVAIYELGKAFGWWTDVSSMLDAIKAGIMELWEAFINHPDVQAVIQAIGAAWDWVASGIGWAWNALLEFFGIAEGGDFDILHALINGIGEAWNLVREPIIMVINLISTIVGTLWNVATGNMDVITVIQNIWNSLVTNMPIILTALFNVYKTIWTSIFNFVISLVRNIVNRVTSFMRSLIGKVYSALMGVVASIRSAISAWITAAVAKVTQLVNDVVNWFSQLPNKISSALSGVVSAITKPFQQAYDDVKGIVDSIVNKASEALSAMGGIAAGGVDLAAGGETITLNNNNPKIIDESNNQVDVNIKHSLILDLINVPAHIDTATLIEMLRDKEVLKSLTNNLDFQTLDSKVKNEILRKANRARGV